MFIEVDGHSKGASWSVKDFSLDLGYMSSIV
jgi:hypothetical protein